MPKSDQGVQSGRYQVVPRTLIFVTNGEAVLLLKGAPHKRLWANRYNGIGGHLERGEDVLSAARRELLEETGLSVAHLWLCGTVMVDASDAIGIGIFVLRGEYAGGKIAGSQEGTPEWIPFSRLPELPLVEDLPILLPKILAMQPGAPPFAACTRYDEQDRLQIRFGTSNE